MGSLIDLTLVTYRFSLKGFCIPRAIKIFMVPNLFLNPSQLHPCIRIILPILNPFILCFLLTKHNQFIKGKGVADVILSSINFPFIPTPPTNPFRRLAQPRELRAAFGTMTTITFCFKCFCIPATIPALLIITRGTQTIG